MSLYRNAWTDAAGRRRTAARWSLEFRDHFGVRRRVALFRTRAASEDFRHRLARVLDERRAGTEIRAESVGWVADLPASIRDRLVAWDIVPAHQLAALWPLDRLVDEFEAELASRGRTAAHVRSTARYVRAALEGTGAARWVDVDPEAIDRWLDARTGAPPAGWSIAHRNAHAQALRSFGRWLTRSGRVTGADVLARVSKRSATREPRRRARRTLAPEQVAALIAAAASSEAIVEGLTGPERALGYALAAWCGLRRSEIGRLRVGDYRRDPVPHLALAGAITKSGAPALQPVPPPLAAMLEEAVRGRHSTAAVVERFGLVNGGALMRADLALIGERYKDDRGRYCDFHALRHQYATESGLVAPTETDHRRMTRHTSESAAARYRHAQLERDADLAAELPSVRAAMPDELRRAVGDHGGHSRGLTLSRDDLPRHERAALDADQGPVRGKTCQPGPLQNPLPARASGFESPVRHHAQASEGAYVTSTAPAERAAPADDHAGSHTGSDSDVGHLTTLDLDVERSIVSSGLREDEAHLVHRWRDLTEDQRARILAILDEPRTGQGGTGA